MHIFSFKIRRTHYFAMQSRCLLSFDRFLSFVCRVELNEGKSIAFDVDALNFAILFKNAFYIERRIEKMRLAS